MRLYVDDDSVQKLLLRLLRSEGHDVEIPADTKMVGAPDSAQMLHAVQADRVLVSRNHEDFLILDDLIAATGGSHPGILIVCRENNRRRDMTPRGIVRALANLLSTSTPIKNQLIVLNHWR